MGDHGFATGLDVAADILTAVDGVVAVHELDTLCVAAGIPGDDFMACGAEFLGDLVQHARDGGVGFDYAVVCEEAYHEGAGEGGIVDVLTPREGDDAGVEMPGGGVDDGFRDEMEGGEAAGHGADGGGDVFLAFGRDWDALVGESPALV